MCTRVWLCTTIVCTVCMSGSLCTKHEAQPRFDPFRVDLRPLWGPSSLGVASISVSRHPQCGAPVCTRPALTVRLSFNERLFAQPVHPGSLRPLVGMDILYSRAGFSPSLGLADRPRRIPAFPSVINNPLSVYRRCTSGPGFPRPKQQTVTGLRGPKQGPRILMVVCAPGSASA